MEQYLAILEQYGGSIYAKSNAKAGDLTQAEADTQKNALNAAKALNAAAAMNAAAANGAATVQNAPSQPADRALASTIEIAKTITGAFIPQKKPSGPSLSAGQRLYLERWPVAANEVQVLSPKAAYTVAAESLIVFDDCDESAYAAARIRKNTTVRIEIIAGARGMYIDAKGNERWAPMGGLVKK